MITTVTTPRPISQSPRIGPGIINAANNITYTITVTNAGPVHRDDRLGRHRCARARWCHLRQRHWRRQHQRPGRRLLAADRQLRQRRQHQFGTSTVIAPATGIIDQHGDGRQSGIRPDATGNNTSAPMITAVTPQADLSVTKAGPGSVNAANNITYTLTVANAGPSVATSVVVTDALPANVTFISATGGGTTKRQRRSVLADDPRPDQRRQHQLERDRAQHGPRGWCSHQHTAVGSPVSDPTPGNNTSAPAITLINAQADLSNDQGRPRQRQRGQQYYVYADRGQRRSVPRDQRGGEPMRCART